MRDKEIVELFIKGEESALFETEKQYKNYCIKVAENILGNREDAEECWNDVLSKAWKAAAETNPENLRLWLGKIARNTALAMLEAEKAKKRDGGIKLQLDELAECIPAPFSEAETDSVALRDFLNGFIKKLPKEQRRIFIKRYWLCESISEIAEKEGSSENRISLVLFRIRKRLKKELEKEDLNI